MASPGKTIDELRKLPVADRLQLVEDLWDSIAEDSSEETFPVTPELAEELDRRLADLEADPDSAIPWEVVRDRIRRLSGGRDS
ncbi:MAG: addiction module protein [Candidatus Binatia bacterium]